MAQPAMALARAEIRSSSSSEVVMAVRTSTGPALPGPTSQTWNRVAIPKCSSMVRPSLLVNATRMPAPSSVVREALRLRGVRLQQVRHLEDQVLRAPVAGPDPGVGAQPVEDRVAGAQVGLHARRGGRLPAVRVGDEEVHAPG